MNASARALIMLFVALGAGCADTRAAPPGAPQAVPVRLSEVRSAVIENATEYIARMESRRSIELKPQVDGRITRIFVQSGDAVTAGARVLEIDPRQQRATLDSAEEQRRSAEASLLLATRDYERAQALYTHGAITRQELDQARTNYEAAEAALGAQASRVGAERVQLKYFLVSAPFDGVVGDVPARLGDQVTSSTVLTTINQIQRLQVYVYVAGENAPKLKLGLPVQIVDATKVVVDSGVVDFVSPRVERDTQTVLIKATIPNEKGALRQAESVRARIVFGAEEHLVVPVTAVSRLGGQTFVFVAERTPSGLVARRRPVEATSISGSDYVVEKGLAAHDLVVVSGVQKLSDGTPVRPEE